jgi:hypothetical protein
MRTGRNTGTETKNTNKSQGATETGGGARIAWLTALAAFSLVSTAGGSCGTSVSGPIVNQTWTSNNSPYCVVGPINVAGLTINPGVTVNFTSNYAFEVDGVLAANGTPTAPIVFMGTNGGWQGIYFNYSSPGSVLAYCTISNSVNSGIRIAESSPTIVNCTIVSNSAANGGGIYVTSLTTGGPVLQDCLVTNNIASGQGGGVYASMGTNTLLMDGCLLSGNVVNPRISVGNGSWYVGGGVCVSGSSLLKNCVIRNNTCYSMTGSPQGSGVSAGGGIYSDTGSTDLRNCVISGNQAQAIHGSGGGSSAGGGGIYIYSGSLTMANSIISSNITSGNSMYGGGLYIGDSAQNASLVNCTLAYNNTEGFYSQTGSAQLLNSIVYFNASDGTQIVGTTNVTYCDVQNGFTGTGNINRNPIFLSTSDLIIVTGSPCIDAGNPNPAYNDVCLAPCGLSLGTVTNDMGADGGPGACGWTSPCVPVITTQPQDQVSCLGHSATFTVSATNGTPPLSYQWYFNTNTLIVNATNASLTLTNLQRTNAGKYSVVVSNPGGSTNSAMANLILYEAYTYLQVDWYFDSYMFAGLDIAGQPGSNYVLKYTTDLRNTNWATWTPLTTNTMGSSGWFFYLDEESADSPMRFYGAKLNP